MKKYEKKFTQEELNKIFTLSNCKNRIKKLMSVYFYYSTLADENGVFSCSKTQIYKNHIKSKKMSKSLFFELSKIIEDVFYKPEKISSKNEELDKKLDKKLDIEKNAKSLTTKGIEPHCESDNVFNVLNTYTYTVNTNSSEFMSTEDLINLANDLFAEFKVKSHTVQNMVISKLQGVKNINVKGALSYVTKVIIDKKSIQEANREFYYKNLNIQKNKKAAEKTATFNCNTFKNNKKQLKFNNFTPREYDYDLLERKLLGWE